MKNIRIEINRIVCIALCVIALVGFVLPAIYISIDFVGNSRSTSLSVATIFNRDEAMFGDTDFYTSSRESAFADTFRDSFSDIFTDMFANVRTDVITSVGAYFITLLLLITILIFMFVGKLKKSVNVMLSVSFVFMLYAGNTILSTQEPMMETLYSGLVNALGFLAFFLNIPELVNISFNLGNGYWLTLIAIGCMLLLNIFMYIRKRFYGRRDSDVVYAV